MISSYKSVFKLQKKLRKCAIRRCFKKPDLKSQNFRKKYEHWLTSEFIVIAISVTLNPAWIFSDINYRSENILIVDVFFHVLLHSYTYRSMIRYTGITFNVPRNVLMTCTAIYGIRYGQSVSHIPVVTVPVSVSLQLEYA